MITLGIETSCDETACAVINRSRVLSNTVSSSVHLHSKYGGVVPEIASRHHTEYIVQVFKKALKKADKTIKDIDLIAVTQGPGLCGSLLTGISFAKGLSYALSKPLIGVNHLTAHLYANFADKKKRTAPKYPFIGLIISGGHTSILLCRSLDDMRTIGQTQDDAVGEAFDKVAKIMNLGYPGGPAIEEQASSFRGEDIVPFPKAYLAKGSLDFSFSGIKTSVLYYLKEKRMTAKLMKKVAFSFQEAVFDVVCDKVILACKKHNIKTLCVGGGVSANTVLAAKLGKKCLAEAIKLFLPDFKYCLDNASMVAVLGQALYNNGASSDLYLSAEPGMQPECLV